MNPARRNLPLLLLHAREAAMGHFRPVLKRFGLTDQQWRILRALSEATEGLEAGQIAEACKIQKPSLTGIVTRMVEMKLVDRDWSEVDQRRQRVSLTAKGSALVDRMTPFIDRQYQRIERMIGVEQLNDVYRTLDTVLALLNDAGASAADRNLPWRGRPGRDAGDLALPLRKRRRPTRGAKRLPRSDRRLRG